MEEQFSDFVEQNQARILAALANDESGKPANLQLTKSVFGDRVAFTRLRACFESREIADPRLRRQADVLYHLFLPHQTTADLTEAIEAAAARAHSVISEWRGSVGAGSIDHFGLMQVFRKTPQPGPRLLAYARVRELAERAAPLVLELVALRNRAARELGFNDHFELACQLFEIESSTLTSLQQEIDKATTDAYVKFKHAADREHASAFKIRAANLQAWHLSHPIRVTLPPDEEATGILKEDLAAAAAFYKHAEIPTPPSLRSLGTVKRSETDAMDRWCGLLAAVRRLLPSISAELADPTLPPLLRGSPHPILQEALLWIFNDELTHPESFATALHLTPQKATPMKLKLIDRFRHEALVVTRFSGVVHRLVRNLYQHPGEDHASHFADDLARTMKNHQKDGAQSPWWAVLPDVLDVFPRTIVRALGALLAEQLRSSLPPPSEGKGLLSDPDARRLLREQVLEPGLARSWSATISHLSGQPLSTASLISRFG